MSTEQPKPGGARRFRVPRRAWWIALPLAVIVVVGWAAWRAWSLDRSLTAAKSDVSQVRADLDNDRWAALTTDTDALQRHAARAASASRDPTIVVAGWLPVLGRNVHAASALARALHSVAADAIGPLVHSRMLSAVETHANSTTQLAAALQADASIITRAADVADSADADVARIAGNRLLSRLRAPVMDAQAKLARLRADLDDARAAAGVVPGLLGESRPSIILLLFQTPAEPRATGGLIGAWGEVRAQQGKLVLAGFGPDDDLPTLASYPAGVSADVEKDYGVDPLLPLNANLTASFPDAARLVATSWTHGPGHGVVPDTVVSVDPVALGDILDVVGSVRTSSGVVVDGSNAADDLLRQEYYTFGNDQAARVSFLGDVTRAVFDRITAGGFSGAALVREVGAVSGQGRITVWSATAEQELAWQQLDVAGDLGASNTSQLRFALNSIDASKLGAFLHTSVAVDNCATGGPSLTIRLTNDAPATLPDYMQSHLTGIPPMTARLVYSLYLSPAWGISSVTLDGREQSFSAQTEQSWRLVRATVQLARGATAVVVVHLQPGHGASVVRRLDVAPQAYPVGVSVSDPAVCGQGDR